MPKLTFRQLFALVVFAAVFLFDLSLLLILTWHGLDQEAREIVGSMTTLLNTGGLIVIIQYYFGNSQRGTTEAPVDAGKEHFQTA